MTVDQCHTLITEKMGRDSGWDYANGFEQRSGDRCSVTAKWYAGNDAVTAAEVLIADLNFEVRIEDLGDRRIRFS